MNLQLLGYIHTLPLWFLVFSLVLPRLALLVYWLENGVIPFHIHGWLALVAALLLPRALVLFLIYQDQGVSGWFVLHAVVALLVWIVSGNASSRKSHD